MRQAVWTRAGGQCEYCRLHQDDAFEGHEPDHVIAEQHRGPTHLENLALACWECNRRKGRNVASVDPVSAEIVRLFNPRSDQWQEHFKFEGLRIMPITAIARATEALLEFNSPEILALRSMLATVGRYPPPTGKV
jgi:hypothetical protein